jgi:putative DNA primase/helicase
VNRDSLNRLVVGWSEKRQAFTFPMVDGVGRTIGIKLRTGDGTKRSIQGSSEGLFVPNDLPPSGRLFLTEGASDTAALLDLGFAALGCPSAGSGIPYVLEFVRRRGTGATLVIVADNDDAGRKGAGKLARALADDGNSVKIIKPPDGIKDAREWLQHGATAEDVEQLVHGASECDTGGPVMTCVADVQPQSVEWLWPHRIALGKLTLVAGEPGLGKSFLTLDMAAHVTNAKPWPDQTRCLDGSVLLISAEDDVADTIRPRLDKAGANVERIQTLDAVRRVAINGKAKECGFTLADIPALSSALKRLNDCKLVVIDPVSAYLLSTDSHNNAEVRGLLSPLAKLAADHRVAVVIVTHLNKAAGMSAMHRVTGSGAFVAASRAAYIVVPDGNDSTRKRRLFLPLKNNLGNDRNGLAFSIQNGCVEWERGEVTMTAEAALAVEAGHGTRGPKQTERKEAKAWLRELLADAAMPAQDIFRQAKEAGFSQQTIRRAKEALRIKPHRTDFQGGWVWKLPEVFGAKLNVTPPPHNLSILAKPEHLGVFTPKNGDKISKVNGQGAKVFKFPGTGITHSQKGRIA